MTVNEEFIAFCEKRGVPGKDLQDMRECAAAVGKMSDLRLRELIMTTLNEMRQRGLVAQLACTIDTIQRDLAEEARTRKAT